MYNIQGPMIESMAATADALQHNGISTTIKCDILRYDVFTGHGGKERVQWDYRDKRGVLHTSICNDTATARTQAEKYGFVAGVSREERV